MTYEVFHGKPLATVIGPMRSRGGAFSGRCGDCGEDVVTPVRELAQKWCDEHNAEKHGEESD